MTSPEKSKDGKWPTAIQRFRYDFRTEEKAPNNDGAIAPSPLDLSWVEKIPGESLALALDVARRANDQSRERVSVTENKANRTGQTALTLLGFAVALGSYQGTVALNGSKLLFLLIVPSIAAVIFLSLAAIEAFEIDRVGFYAQGSLNDLGPTANDGSIVTVIKSEARGRQLSNWTAEKKLTDLMQARAWMSRGLASVIVAALVASASSAVIRRESEEPKEGQSVSQPSVLATNPPSTSVVPASVEAAQTVVSSSTKKPSKASGSNAVTTKIP